MANCFEKVKIVTYLSFPYFDELREVNGFLRNLTKKIVKRLTPTKLESEPTLTKVES